MRDPNFISYEVSLARMRIERAKAEVHLRQLQAEIYMRNAQAAMEQATFLSRADIQRRYAPPAPPPTLDLPVVRPTAMYGCTRLRPETFVAADPPAAPPSGRIRRVLRWLFRSNPIDELASD